MNKRNDQSHSVYLVILLTRLSPPPPPVWPGPDNRESKVYIARERDNRPKPPILACLLFNTATTELLLMRMMVLNDGNYWPVHASIPSPAPGQPNLITTTVLLSRRRHGQQMQQQQRTASQVGTRDLGG